MYALLAIPVRSSLVPPVLGIGIQILQIEKVRTYGIIGHPDLVCIGCGEKGDAMKNLLMVGLGITLFQIVNGRLGGQVLVIGEKDA